VSGRPDLPLGGIRVLDLSRLLPGGYCTLLMADLGAEVVKVEQPGRGDYLRLLPPRLPDGTGAMHAWLNRGKRSVTVNLRHPDGQAVFLDLADRADVVVESFRPGVLDRVGVGWQVLRARNPRLVYVAISGYGATGPYRDRAGHDIDYLAYSGALSLNGHPETGPWPPALQIGDLGGGGLLGLVAALAALHMRERTGLGQFCDVSMTDGILSWLGVHAAAFAATGVPPAPGTMTLTGGLAAYGVYRCADGKHVAVGALEPQFFAQLVDRLGAPELAHWHLDPDRQTELRGRLAEAFATRTRAEWTTLFADVDACVAPVLDLAEALADESARERGMVSDHLVGGATVPWVSGVVPRLTGTPGRPGGPAPALGADTDAVLAEAGRTADDIAALRVAGAV
jgi:alpha-methylacyl-CoA racemase